MIICQAPLRVSFLGGGTDYPEHFLRHGGAALSTTIDRYCIVSVHPLTSFVDYRFRIHYSKVESASSVDEIQHPSARECLRFLGIEGGVEIHYLNDLPARTGLGSSSSATVALLMALHAFRGRMVSRERVAAEAVHVERELIRERVGFQDQYAAAFGGFLHMQFGKNGSVDVRPVVLKEERIRELRRHLLLLYTGFQRTAHEILEEQVERTRSGSLAGELLKLGDLVAKGVDALASERPLGDFGGLLHEGWLIKRGLSSRITDEKIDDCYRRAREAGAIGGKLLGAGGGGFLLLLAPPERHGTVIAALPELKPVGFDFSAEGCRTIFYRS
ncbi:MAG: kinase [Planctomycetes bacterium]|nr:kinase [Planctomycetota bacterium]